MNALPLARLPIVAAPMAGGATTFALSAAVARSGGFPFVPAGYLTPDALAAEIAQVRGLGSPFGVNLFVPSAATVDAQAVRAYADDLVPEADAYGLTLNPTPITDDDHWDAKLRLLVTQPVPVVSFTFGLPDPAAIRALQAVGTVTLASVTSPIEAAGARHVGVDGLIVQGAGAGGHSAMFDPTRDPEPISTVELARRVRAAVDLPLIAAGGVDGPDAVAELLTAGAEAVAVGTLLLRTDEAGTSPTHRRALADPGFEETALTRAFTGRPARALLNGFMRRHRSAPTAYPAVHHLTRPIRQAAARAGDADRLHLWAGTGYRAAPSGSTGDVIAWLTGGVPAVYSS